MMNQSMEGPCPRCGSPLPADAPEGLCPRCLGLLNLESRPGASSAAGHASAPAPSPSPEELAPHFPQLEIVRCVGRGGMGVVYEARQKSLDRRVALKLLAPERIQDPLFEERFRREARALARLNHPHIVTIHDFGVTTPPSIPGTAPNAPLYHLLMEFVDGASLRQLLEAGQLTPEQALGIVPPICDALQYAHDQGVVHRDIKPENLLLDAQGRVKIADFGIARLLGGGTPVETAAGGQVLGTAMYMAPEQHTQPSKVDHRADIYSLGVVFYEMLTGELPVGRFAPPSRTVSVDVRLDDIVLRALEQQPERRYQTAGEFKACVDSMVRPAPGGTPASPLGSAGDPPRSMVQRLFRMILPANAFAAMRRESQGWKQICGTCGHGISVWDSGGVRFLAAGSPSRGRWCSRCGRFRFFRTVWQPSDPGRGLEESA